jgi:hypothetical protein
MKIRSVEVHYEIYAQRNNPVAFAHFSLVFLKTITFAEKLC